MPAGAAAKQRFVVIEAADHVGGRCVTDTRTFGVPFDRGAHWIHQPDVNPLLKPAAPAGIDVYPAPRGQSVRVGPRNARDAELENFLTAWCVRIAPSPTPPAPRPMWRRRRW